MVGWYKRSEELHRDLHRVAENGSKLPNAFSVSKWENEAIPANHREQKVRQAKRPPEMAALESSAIGYGFGAGGLGAGGRAAVPAGLAALPGADGGAATLDWAL